MCLKAGADPNVQRSCQSGRGEDTALMWPIVLGAAALLDGHEGKPSSCTYHLAGFFLKYGANPTLRLWQQDPSAATKVIDGVISIMRRGSPL